MSPILEEEAATSDFVVALILSTRLAGRIDYARPMAAQKKTQASVWKQLDFLTQLTWAANQFERRDSPYITNQLNILGINWFLVSPSHLSTTHYDEY